MRGIDEDCGGGWCGTGQQCDPPFHDRLPRRPRVHPWPEPVSTLCARHAKDRRVSVRFRCVRTCSGNGIAALCRHLLRRLDDGQRHMQQPDIKAMRGIVFRQWSICINRARRRSVNRQDDGGGRLTATFQTSAHGGVPDAGPERRSRSHRNATASPGLSRQKWPTCRCCPVTSRNVLTPDDRIEKHS